MFAIGKFSSDPSTFEKPLALTVLPSTKDSTKACFPAQLVSAQLSKPSLVPSNNSSFDSVGCLKLLMLYKDVADAMVD